MYGVNEKTLIRVKNLINNFNKFKFSGLTIPETESLRFPGVAYGKNNIGNWYGIPKNKNVEFQIKDLEKILCETFKVEEDENYIQFFDLDLRYHFDNIYNKENQELCLELKKEVDFDLLMRDGIYFEKNSEGQYESVAILTDYFNLSKILAWKLLKQVVKIEKVREIPFVNTDIITIEGCGLRLVILLDDNSERVSQRKIHGIHTIGVDSNKLRMWREQIATRKII